MPSSSRQIMIQIYLSVVVVTPDSHLKMPVDSSHNPQRRVSRKHTHEDDIDVRRARGEVSSANSSYVFQRLNLSDFVCGVSPVNIFPLSSSKATHFTSV